ncbi:MAG: hypothetical protein Q8P67_09940, partial [archaeon]|nr:hypothetical protein [archaeon]
MGDSSKDSLPISQMSVQLFESGDGTGPEEDEADSLPAYRPSIPSSPAKPSPTASPSSKGGKMLAGFYRRSLPPSTFRRQRIDPSPSQPLPGPHAHHRSLSGGHEPPRQPIGILIVNIVESRPSSLPPSFQGPSSSSFAPPSPKSAFCLLDYSGQAARTDAISPHDSPCWQDQSFCFLLDAADEPLRIYAFADDPASPSPSKLIGVHELDVFGRAKQQKAVTLQLTQLGRFHAINVKRLTPSLKLCDWRDSSLSLTDAMSDPLSSPPAPSSSPSPDRSPLRHNLKKRKSRRESKMHQPEGTPSHDP